MRGFMSWAKIELPAHYLMALDLHGVQIWHLDLCDSG